jgi:hypothetical protein
MYPMTDQPDDVLTRAGRPPQVPRRRRRAPGGGRAEGVRGRAVEEEPPPLTAERRYRPLRRVTAAGRAAGGDVSGRLPAAAGSPSTAAREPLAGLERSRPPRTGRWTGSDGGPADIGRAEGP